MGSELADIPGIPEGVKESFAKLVDEPLVARDQLQAEVDRYAGILSRAEGEWLDRELATDLVNVSRQYLRAEWDKMDEAGRHLVQAAIRYFVKDDDFGGDFQSCAGFDDDQLVMNAVARHLGRQDLVV